MSKNSNSSEINLEDQPIKYSTSLAAKWKARESRTGPQQEIAGPAYQPIVVSFSFIIFMIYFCILREENDIDELFSKSLFDSVEGLEEKQLQICIEYNLSKGLSTKELEARLEQIQSQKDN